MYALGSLTVMIEVDITTDIDTGRPMKAKGGVKLRVYEQVKD